MNFYGYKIFADDTAPRYVTSSAILDYDTMAGADKFGNLFVVRLPEKVNEDILIIIIWKMLFYYLLELFFDSE